MRFRVTAAALALVALLLPSAADAAFPKAPASFFGIAPQAALSDEDGSYMRAGGIGSVRLPLVWAGIQPAADGGHLWEAFDREVAVAAKARLRVLPSVGSTPHWLAPKSTTLPVSNARQRAAWTTFLRAAVQRYGPRGSFWAEHGPGSAEPLPRLPIRAWQIWNEPNFFYFAFPVSPARYGKLVTLASRAIKAVDRRADVIVAGLFGRPKARGKRGMPAATFLARLYAQRGLARRFDGVALHPYAVNTRALVKLVAAMRKVVVANRDRAPLYITEIGWGSQSNSKRVAFEQGVRGQVRELRGAYRYLLGNRRRLNLAGVYWFSWKDLPGSCDFCDSAGLFHAGPGLRPKPAWRAFVAISGGRVRP